MENQEEKPVLKKHYDKCRRCGRKLTTPESAEIGFGKTCAKKYLAESALIPLFEVKRHEQKPEKKSSQDEHGTSGAKAD